MNLLVSFGGEEVAKTQFYSEQMISASPQIEINPERSGLMIPQNSPLNPTKRNIFSSFDSVDMVVEEHSKLNESVDGSMTNINLLYEALSSLSLADKCALSLSLGNNTAVNSVAPSDDFEVCIYQIKIKL